MIKLGMIGCGGMGNTHGPTLVKLPDVKVVATCDLIEEKAKSLAQKIGVDRWTTNYRELLSDVDAVWVCTEPFNRVDVVTTAAAAGKHIFTEKPICNTLEGADAMMTAAKKAKVVYMLGYCLRFWNPFRLMHDTLVSGELGDMVTCWTRRYMPFDMSNLWYGWQEKSGGVELDFGSHDCDWLRWMGGDAKTVFGGRVTVRPTMHASEHAEMLMLFEKGGMGTMDISWSANVFESSVGVVGTKGAIIVGEDGRVHKRIGYDQPEQILDADGAFQVDPTGKRTKDGDSGTKNVAGETMYEHWLRCIREGLTPLTSPEEGRKTLLTIMALRESAKLGKSVEVKK